ncbi:MAG: methyltransferase domain-containing protein [Bacteroidetes bacterium]|nr:methyltransferase domain-containing protein [Bacteroidota bacterium]
MDFSKTNFSFRRSIFDYAKVQYLISGLRRNSKFQLTDFGGTEYLNVGCGANIYKHFLNLDWQWRPGVNLCWDLLKGIPLKENSFIGIFTEHCLEHLPFTKIPYIFSEFYRILKPGGRIRIVVPDGQLYMEIYNNRLNGGEQKFPYEDNFNNKTPAMYVNEVFRDHGHLFCYDFQTMKLLLESAGFHTVIKSSFNNSMDKMLHYDSESRKGESLYLEALK